jgi:hypothetical protein
MLLLLLLLLVLLLEGVGVGVAEWSWRCYKKELVLCQLIEPGNRFRISLLSLFLILFFSLETVESKKRNKNKNFGGHLPSLRSVVITASSSAARHYCILRCRQPLL